MKQYLLSVYQPDGDPPPPEVLDRVMADVEAWNKEVRAAGAWVFNAGLYPASTATVVRLRDDEELITDGPFVEGKEHIGGFPIIMPSDLDSALGWGYKLTPRPPLPHLGRPGRRQARSP